MTPLDRIEDLARDLAGTPPPRGDQLTRIEHLLRNAVRKHTSSSIDFLPGTGRLGGQGHDLGDPSPATADTTRKALAAARAALHHSETASPTQET